jgi:glyoxylase-like metal-dependent hydrolase (beta-lactamase superfamily II)
MRPPWAQRFDEAGLVLFERGWLSSNNLLFIDGADNVLVDSGYCSHAEQTVALVRHALQGVPLRRIVNTHLHSDHCGGNHALQAAFGCDVDVPGGEVGKVDAWDEAALTYRDTGQRCPRFRRTGALRDGGVVRLGCRDWLALAAPGHDPESLVFYQPELKLLVSADALWENGFGVVFPEIEGSQAFDDVAETLDRISALPIEWVIPGHGPPFGNTGGAIARARSRLAGWVEAPARHARHAAKVLVKFHLLEHQQRSAPDLRNWMARTRYMRMLHGAYFAAVAFDEWADAVVDELCAIGALRSGHGQVFDH